MWRLHARATNCLANFCSSKTHVSALLPMSVVMKCQRLTCSVKLQSSKFQCTVYRCTVTCIKWYPQFNLAALSSKVSWSSKLILTVITWCHILREKCINFDFSQGCMSDHDGKACNAPQDFLAGFKESYFWAKEKSKIKMGGDWREGERKEGIAGEKRKEEGKWREGRDYYWHWRYDTWASMWALPLPVLRHCHKK